MTQAVTAPTAFDTKPDSPPDFYCDEVWGGNRPIDSAFELPGIHGRLFSRPCGGGQGGDIHYTSICGSGLISRLCLADVAGHGEAVARVSDSIHKLLRRYMNSLDQRRVLGELNRQLVAADLTGMATAVAVSYFPPVRTLSISYAGHPPAWFYRAQEKRWEPLLPLSRVREIPGAVDLPLAVDAETAFTRVKLKVRPRDRLLILTDGVLEAPGPGGELFGEQRVADVLAAGDGQPVSATVDRLLAALAEFTGDARLAHDDVTMLMMEIVPGPKAFGIWHGLKRRLFRRPSGKQRRAG